jgi:hypothetical protein
MDKKKALLTGLAIVGVIAGKLVIKFGASFGVTEAVVESSKSEPWDLEFKSAVVGTCSQAVNDEAKKNQTELAENDLNNYSKSYCSCVFAEIEKEKIIPTKYNVYKTTEDEYVTEVDKIISAYMDSEKGGKVINDCIAMAQQTALRVPASEVEEGDDEGIPESAAAAGTEAPEQQDASL